MVYKNAPKGEGTTSGEKHLAWLADAAFLKLWSYPNPFRDQRSGVGRDGKEICDLIAVCGKDIVIFSDKDISWSSKSTEVAWSRWYKKSIYESSIQLAGAERWIRSFPERIFVDKECSVKIPLAIENILEPKIHKVVIARGASKACREFFSSGTGSMALNYEIRGDEHWNKYKHEDVLPFEIGDVHPEGTFTHIFDEANIDFILRELDTITDFVSYLRKRAELARSKKLIVAESEESLLSLYLSNVNDDDEHDFCVNGTRIIELDQPVGIDGTFHQHYVGHAQYESKELANKISYFWDDLTNYFAEHMMHGTILQGDDDSYDLSNNEISLRYMAKQSRVNRRILSETFLSARQVAQNAYRMARIASPLQSKDEKPTLGFLFLFVRSQPDTESMEEYRRFRLALAKTYVRGYLEKIRSLERIVCIAVDIADRSPSSTREKLFSEELIYMEQLDWTEALVEQIHFECKSIGILGTENTFRYESHEEYPT